MSTISIIGSGGMATAISGRIAKAGHTVEVVSRDPAKARALANQLAAEATTGTYGAAPAGDIVILAVPYASASAVVTEFGGALDGKVIIDITNPVTPDMSGLVTPHGSSGAQEIAKGAPANAGAIRFVWPVARMSKLKPRSVNTVCVNTLTVISTSTVAALTEIRVPLSTANRARTTSPPTWAVGRRLLTDSPSQRIQKIVRYRTRSPNGNKIHQVSASKNIGRR